MNGLFPGRTTGTTQNTGFVTARVFFQGAALANLEMLQYHPTTVAVPGKRLLVSEAARGEGGRLFAEANGKRRYFMEELSPMGNLAPRDVISREMARLAVPSAMGRALVWQETIIRYPQQMLKAIPWGAHLAWPDAGAMRWGIPRP